MPRARVDKEGPHPVDTYVGARVKSRRLMLGLSQEDLAASIGLTFQQVQKYERGTNRISVSRLTEIGRALKAPLDYFLDGCAPLAQTKKPMAKGFAEGKQAVLEPDTISKKDVMELVRAYQKISTPQLKKQLLEMAKAMAKSE